MGRTAPNPSEAKTLEDGVVVPLGKPVDHSSSKVWLSLCFNTFFSPNHDYINSQIDFVWLFLQGTLLYNEYIVYNTEQIKMRYVIQVKFNYKY